MFMHAQYPLAYSSTSEEVSHILAKKLMGNGDIKESRVCGDSSSSSPISRTRKESLNHLLKLQQLSKVPRLKGEVSLFYFSRMCVYQLWLSINFGIGSLKSRFGCF